MRGLIKVLAIVFVQLALVGTLGFAERIEVTLGSINIGAAFPEGAEDPMRDWIEERFDITLTPKDYNWGDMETKINTWAASATLPDVFFMAHIGTGRYFQWIEDGVVRALPEDLSPWPDVEWTINNTGVREYDVDGRTYVLPRGGAKVLPSSRPGARHFQPVVGQPHAVRAQGLDGEARHRRSADRRGVHRDVRAVRHRRSGRQR